jgi:hypothetical protein
MVQEKFVTLYYKKIYQIVDIVPKPFVTLFDIIKQSLSKDKFFKLCNMIGLKEDTNMGGGVLLT